MFNPLIRAVRCLLLLDRKWATGNASSGDVIASHGAQGLMGSGVPIVYYGKTGLAYEATVLPGGGE